MTEPKRDEAPLPWRIEGEPNAMGEVRISDGGDRSFAVFRDRKRAEQAVRAVNGEAKLQLLDRTLFETVLEKRLLREVLRGIVQTADTDDIIAFRRALDAGRAALAASEVDDG